MEKRYRLMAGTEAHWDRERYTNFRKTRIKLVRLMDTVLDLPDADLKIPVGSAGWKRLGGKLYV